MSETSRTGKSVKNVAFSLVLQMLTILTNFVVRITFVRTLGKEYNGLNSLFTEVIAMLSLAELGVGSSITYSLYAPLSESNTEKLIQIMTLFRKAYRIVAGVIFAVGLLTVPFIGGIVEQVDFSINYIRLIFMLFLIQTASSYLFSYNISLLNADQKNYIISAITGVVKIVAAILNIVGLILTHNYIVYMTVQIISTLSVNIIILIKAYKEYPFLRKRDKLPEKERKRIFANIKNVFIGDISGKITNSTDNILISKFVSTAQCGVYANYALMMNSVRYVFSNMRQSIMGSIGNIMVSEDDETIHAVHKRLTFVYFVFAYVSSMCFYAVSPSFIKLFFGEEYVMAKPIVIVCTVNFFLLIAREPLWGIMAVSGLFEKDKNISVIGSAVNLVVSVAVGVKCGMFGIFLGTSFTLVIQIVLKLLLLYRQRLTCGGMDIFCYWGKSTIVFLLSMVVLAMMRGITDMYTPIAEFFICGILSLIASIAVVVTCYGNSVEFDSSLDIIRRYIFRKRFM